MGALGISRVTLAADVANAGTVTVPAYPTGTTQALLTGTTGGGVSVGNNEYYKQGSGAGTVSFTFGASTITVTNNSGYTWPAGTDLIIGFGTTDRLGSYNLIIGTAANTAKAGNL